MTRSLPVAFAGELAVASLVAILLGLAALLVVRVALATSVVAPVPPGVAGRGAEPAAGASARRLQTQGSTRAQTPAPTWSFRRSEEHPQPGLACIKVRSNPHTPQAEARSFLLAPMRAAISASSRDWPRS